MTVLDWILVAVRWGHALAAVTWVGGSIFYLVVLRPALRTARGGESEVGRAVGAEFRGLVNTAIGVLLLTGVVLSVARLTSNAVTFPYVAVLVAKIVVALYMFYVVRFLRPRVYPEGSEAGGGRLARVRSRLTSATAVLVCGVIAIGLADVLDALFEHGLQE